MSLSILDHLDPSPLTFLCTIRHVTVATITDQDHQQLVGEQYTIEAYVSSSESLLLKCYQSSSTSSSDEIQSSLPEITITIASQSKARLIPPSTLVVPNNAGGSWSLDCSASDSQEFITLQDMLTHFIKFENQQNIRNTLAMINPSSYKVTQVIAEDVFLNRDPNKGKTGDWDSKDEHLMADVEEDDFITTRENYYGHKLPVAMDENIFRDGLELRKVRLIYKTSQCMEVTSDWLARGLVSAGDSIAGYIQSGTRAVEEKVQTPTNRQLVSSKQRHYFDIVFNLTSIVGNMAGQWISRLFHLPAVMQARDEFRMPTPRTQLGNSALQAATRVMEGSKVAAGTVLSASRQGLVQVIEKRYGADAGYMAEKIMGSDKRQTDVMVYFDDQGVSRRVVMQPPPTHYAEHPSRYISVSEEKQQNNLYESQQVVYDSEVIDEKEPEKLVLV